MHKSRPVFYFSDTILSKITKFEFDYEIEILEISGNFDFLIHNNVTKN